MPTADELIDYLHEYFPVRARRLASDIERKRDRTEVLELWFNRLLIKFIGTLLVNAADLEEAYLDERVSRLRIKEVSI